MTACGSILAHQPGSSPNSDLWIVVVVCFLSVCVCVLMGASLHRHNCLNDWLLLINSTPSPSPLPRKQGVGLKVPTLFS